MLGFKSAHGPFTPPQRLAEKYAGPSARDAPNMHVPAAYAGKFSVARAGKAKADKAKAGQGTGKAKGKAKAGQAKGLAPDAPGRYQGYFGCLAGVDENVGRVLAALDELKLAENTVVVFTSDNGFYLGEHGLGDKRSAYEESIRIPLLVRWPKLGAQARGKLVDKLALNIDLAPTILDLAGVKVPAPMHGQSWRPLLEGDVQAAAQWRTAFLYEYFFERNFSIPTVLAVRTQKAKLIQYPGHDDWTELFDLAADPYETKNLAADPDAQGLLAQMRAEFDRQAKAVDFRVPEYADKLPELTP